MESFPVEDVEASLADQKLQRKHSLEELGPEWLALNAERREKAIAEGASEQTDWIYFCSPDWTWRSECGREGWLLWDPETRTQHAFHMTVMS